MRQIIIITTLLFSVIMSGCGPSKKDYSLAERRRMIDDMSNQTLQRLYIEKPAAQQQVADAAGYGVFSNANAYIVFASVGGGYGVVVDKVTGRKTYMRVGAGGLGIGLGAKDYQQVVIFNTRKALIDFVGSGWNVGGQADATAKSGETGGGMAGEGSISKDVRMYTLTDTGLALQATVTGWRYWVDDELNQPHL